MNLTTTVVRKAIANVIKDDLQDVRNEPGDVPSGEPRYFRNRENGPGTTFKGMLRNSVVLKWVQTDSADGNNIDQLFFSFNGEDVKMDEIALALDIITVLGQAHCTVRYGVEQCSVSDMEKFSNIQYLVKTIMQMVTYTASVSTKTMNDVVADALSDSFKNTRGPAPSMPTSTSEKRGKLFHYDTLPIFVTRTARGFDVGVFLPDYSNAGNALSERKAGELVIEFDEEQLTRCDLFVNHRTYSKKDLGHFMNGVEFLRRLVRNVESEVECFGGNLFGGGTGL